MRYADGAGFDQTNGLPTDLGEGKSVFASSFFFRMNENWGLRATHRFVVAAFAALMLLSLSGCATGRWNNGSSYRSNSYGTTRSRITGLLPRISIGAAQVAEMWPKYSFAAVCGLPETTIL